MLQEFYTVAKILALIAVPIAVAIISTQVSKRLKVSEISAQYVSLAIEILRQPSLGRTESDDDNTSSLRDWAIQVLAEYSPVSVPDKLLQSLGKGESTLPRSDDFFDENLNAAKVILKLQKGKPRLFQITKYEFEGDDLLLQNERNEYLNLAANVIDSAEKPTWGHAVAVWLAGIDLHNNSLRYKNWSSDNLDKHVEEMETVHAHLIDRVLQFDSDSVDIQGQMISYLDIHLHNFVSGKHNELRHREE